MDSCPSACLHPNGDCDDNLKAAAKLESSLVPHWPDGFQPLHGNHTKHSCCAGSCCMYEEYTCWESEECDQYGECWETEECGFECAAYGTEVKLITCANCYDFEIGFTYRTENGDLQKDVRLRNCPLKDGDDDFGCLVGVRQENGQGRASPCWVNRDTSAVRFDAPGHSTAGIVFLVLFGIAFLALLSCWCVKDFRYNCAFSPQRMCT